MNQFTIIIMYVAIFGALYFFMIRPQRKQEKDKAAMLATLAVGDTVLTTAGFYGVVIDINADTVIVEFGYNKVMVESPLFNGRSIFVTQIFTPPTL